ncbi:MAG TPA: 30S ribosome-binding factor RbfA [Spirochaetota bacterium]|jgi:ribosome-binding factor A|nr:30S ribosome-binding factor RbfA [Spirochaetota bacterium]OQA98660.1 MAG: Ribosome-binding factor A [Spirochaetes bacterium ADurb.Bin218]HOK02680.1 30S ribosome-binding factor RbfA [Spirochaetota bacterium]HOK92868.1 30S ribosome-binding factor RbfA [Spirochaetota bacterium]HON15530.1 30S ribosome-binding factor RbfA [Spirochaetota bacterium]
MKYRKDRLEELIRRIVSDIIFKEVKDPRIGFVTVTDVELTKDFSEARIGVSILGSSVEVRKSMEGIRSSSGYIQKLLGKELKIRTVPRVYFYLDKSIEQGVLMVDKIEKLTESIKDSEESPEGEEDNN